MKLAYKCGWDGNICDKVIPRVDKEGNILEEPAVYYEAIAEDMRGWSVCSNCGRCGNPYTTKGHAVLV